MTGPSTRWHRVDDGDVPGEGRVRSVEVGGRPLALARCGDRLGALENHCPHQGGPLGEGSIEKGLLRCPWHGYDYDPVTGLPPGGFNDAVPSFPVQERSDGVYVELPDLAHRFAPSATRWSRRSSPSASPTAPRWWRCRVRCRQRCGGVARSPGLRARR